MLVIGPNLAVDQTVAVPRLLPGTIHRVPAVLRLAGGKGTNLARALRTLAADPLLCGFAGGPTGAAYTAYLAAEGVRHRLVATHADMRVCFSIADESTGAQTEVYEQGAEVDADEVATLLDTAAACMDEQMPGDWVALTGSLPRGVPDDLYARLIALAHARGLLVLLDAREPALAPALAAGPDLLKINREELSAWAGAPSTRRNTPEAVARVADRAGRGPRTVIKLGAEQVVITLGAEGAIALEYDVAWHIAAPSIAAVSPVGSGDSAAAGLLVGLSHGASLPEATRLAVAAGSANARNVGAGKFTRAEVDDLLPSCRVRKLGRS